ncbi:MAG TPA: M1 family aminopeptidase, partial [Vicinamibacteria bacterium]|nr:M1 family aminopeptidase [Vicinamibacteria bacterium]
TSFWPEEARYVMPCHDDLADKVTSEMRLGLPRGWRAMANGVLVESRDEAGMRVVHYRLDQPHSPYLIAFVAGEYEEVAAGSTGVPISLFVYRGRGEDGRRSFARASEMLAFLAETTGHPYPWPKLALSVAADFVHGAMENVSAITFSDRHLLDARARLDSSADEVLAHELSHQWWGDLVTPASWNDVWLSEGLATYFTDLWIERDQGADAAAWRRLEHGEAWRAVDLPARRRAVVPDGSVEPWSLLDANVYARPALVLAQLRVLVGEGAFWNGLRTFLGRHALGSAGTADFEWALTAAAGRELGWFFEQWLRRPERPSLRVAWRWDAEAARVSLSVRQEPPAFVLPVEVRLIGRAGARVRRIFVERATQDFSIPADEEPLSVSLDALTHAVAAVDMPRPAAELAVDLTRGATAADRALAARALAAGPRTESVPVLASALRADGFWGVRAEAARALGRLGGADSQEALAGAWRDADPRVRAEAAEAFAAIGGASAAGALQDLLRSDSSDRVTGAALRGLGASRGAGAWETLAAALGRVSAPSRIQTAALQGLAALGDTRAVPLLLEHSSPGRDPQLRREAVDALARLGRGQGVVASRLLRLLSDTDGSVRVAAAKALARLGDPAVRDALRAAAAAEDHPGHRRDLEAALEELQGPP